MNDTKTTQQIEPVLLDSKSAAQLCGCNVKLWRSRNDFALTPKPLKIGRRNYWRRDELLAWIDAACPKRSEWEFRAMSKKNGKFAK
ncbi:MAG: helix-turn-helix transcriptional regulator [Thermoguttaceae bacterium]